MHRNNMIFMRHFYLSFFKDNFIFIYNYLIIMKININKIEIPEALLIQLLSISFYKNKILIKQIYKVAPFLGKNKKDHFWFGIVHTSFVWYGTFETHGREQ